MSQAGYLTPYKTHRTTHLINHLCRSLLRRGTAIPCPQTASGLSPAEFVKDPRTFFEFVRQETAAGAEPLLGTWTVVRPNGDTRYGAFIYLDLGDESDGKSWSTRPTHATFDEALHDVFSIALNDGLSDTLKTIPLPPYTQRASSSIMERWLKLPALTLSEFQGTLQLSSYLLGDLLHPDRWVRQKAAQFGGSVRYAHLACGKEIDPRNGGVINFEIPGSDATSNTLFVRPLFDNIRDAERAVCLLAMSRWKDPKVVAPTLLPTSHPHLGPESLNMWDPRRGNRRVGIQYEAPTAQDSREVKQLNELCDLHNGYVTWILFQRLEGELAIHDPYAPDVLWGVIAQVGKGKRLASQWEAPCLFSSPMKAMQVAAQLALRDLKANPTYFSGALSATDSDIPPGYVEGTTLSNAATNVTEYIEWMEVDDEAIMSGEVIPQSLEAEFLAQRYLAQVAYEYYESFGTDLVGCIMRVTIGDVTQALSFSVPPVYKSNQEAKTALSIHAVHACRLEAVLKELLLKFKAATGTVLKVGYLKWQGRKVGPEFDARNKDGPVHEKLFISKDCYEHIITELSTLKKWSSGPQPSADIALAAAILEAWEGGILETFGLPLQYWPQGVLRDRAQARALASDRSQSTDSVDSESHDSSSKLSDAEKEEEQEEQESDEVKKTAEEKKDDDVHEGRPSS